MIQTIVVGGGAAGMMAALSAARRGGAVTVLEGGEKLGRKILVSGNGRCNLTNQAADVLWHYHSEHADFAGPALRALPLAETLAFFADLGIETYEEKRGRLFPRTNQAASVVEVMLDRLQVLGVTIVNNAKVKRLERRRKNFVVDVQDGRQWQASQVILASGGLSAPQLGADRTGLDLALGLGHTCTPLLPGLTPLISPDPYVHRMQGVKLVAEVCVPLGKKAMAVDTDDLLLTAYGVSGWAVLNLSVRLVPRLVDNTAELQVNLFPGQTPEQLSDALRQRWQRNPHRTLAQSFTGLLTSKLIIPFLERFGFPAQRRVDQLSKAQRWQLAQALTCWPIEVSGPRSFEAAEVTLGGIQTQEINPETLESWLLPGLYFAGEMLDVQGDLGGFNFQWAWSSGYLAGQCRGGVPE